MAGLKNWDYIGSHWGEANLGEFDAAGETDHVDMRGWSGRVYVATVNGATDGVDFEVEGSHNGTDWVALVLEFDGNGDPVTERAVSAGGYDLLFLDSRALPRYVRLNVTSANATNGSVFVVHAERE